MGFFMKYFSSLKTSERISLSFSLFGFVSLIVFLILINVTYFFIWYADQEEMSFSSMNQNYKNYLESNASEKSINDFEWYLLTQDTIIIPDEGDLVCSPGVQKKIKEDPEIISGKYFYRDGDTIYFIYSKYFPEIWEVKVLFDTTPYITSQMIIIKAWLIFIFLVFVLQFFWGRIISRRLLWDLISISERVKDIDINSPMKKPIELSHMPEDDEIRILAEALGDSYDTIDGQTGKLKQFITDVSHEFKTPLMWMSSELDVLEKKREKKSLKDIDIETFFYHTRWNIARLNSLLETLFFLARIEEQNECLIKKKLEIRSYVEKKIELLRQNFSEKTIEVSYDIEKGLMHEIEENTFSILLDNLFSNAVKFSKDEVEIHISADSNSLTIWDRGLGMTKKDLEKIWEKFYRKDTNKEGFGIGLYLVKRIVDICEWRIEVSSKPWEGTDFILYFK